MAEATESLVQLATDGTGKQVRNLQITRVVDDGTGVRVEETVFMQVVAIADADGRLLTSPEDWQDAMLAEAVKTNQLLELLLQAGA